MRNSCLLMQVVFPSNIIAHFRTHQTRCRDVTCGGQGVGAYSCASTSCDVRVVVVVVIVVVVMVAVVMAVVMVVMMVVVVVECARV
jgi:hypothetical protein